MPTSTRNLTLDFMETEKGQFSSFKLDAILGLKYNHENKYSHNFLVQFRNTNTNFLEIVEIAPELLRYKFKLGYSYKKGKIHSKDISELEDYLEINTESMKDQLSLFKVLSKETIKHILGDNDFHSFKYGGNFCYIHEDEESRYIIPSYVVALYYYFRSSSMKEALYKGNPNILYDKLNSNLNDKDDAILVLESYTSKLDGPFLYRFLTNYIAEKGFIDFSRYISYFKNKRDIDNKPTSIIPIKALFPTRETFNIKIRYIEIEDHSSNKKTYLVNEIKNDDSTLDFNKLTVLKKKKKDTRIDLEDGENLHIKGRKPRNRKNNVNTRTPSIIHGTNKIREIENNQNLSLQNKDITYGSLEEEKPIIPVIPEKEQGGDVSISFSKGQNSGDTSSQHSKIENEDENKNDIPKPESFDIFLESIEYIENSNLVNEFIYYDIPQDVPASYNKSNELTSMCSINNRLKQYVACSFEYNDINVILIEVESENNDFATWVLASRNEISEDIVYEILEMRYSEQKILDTIKELYNNLNGVKFFTHRHAQINDENEHEEVLERWLLRLFYKIN